MFKFKEKLKSIKKWIPILYYAMKHKKTPWVAKIMATLTVGYALSPIDLIPDFIPVIGYLDDLIILPLMIAVTIKMIPKSILEACRLQVMKARDTQFKKSGSMHYQSLLFMHL